MTKILEKKEEKKILFFFFLFEDIDSTYSFFREDIFSRPAQEFLLQTPRQIFPPTDYYTVEYTKSEAE